MLLDWTTEDSLLYKKNKLEGFFIPVCVVKQCLSLCDLWQWCGGRGSAAIGGIAGVVCGLRWTDAEANCPAWWTGLWGVLEHIEVIFSFGGQNHWVAGKEPLVGSGIIQGSTVALKKGGWSFKRHCLLLLLSPLFVKSLYKSVNLPQSEKNPQKHLGFVQMTDALPGNLTCLPPPCCFKEIWS